MDYKWLIEAPSFCLAKLRRTAPLVNCICAEINRDYPDLSKIERTNIMADRFKNSYPRTTPNQESQFSEKEYYTVLALAADLKQLTLGWRDIDLISLFYIGLYLNSQYILEKICYHILNYTNFWTIRSLFLCHLPDGGQRTALMAWLNRYGNNLILPRHSTNITIAYVNNFLESIFNEEDSPEPQAQEVFTDKLFLSLQTESVAPILVWALKNLHFNHFVVTTLFKFIFAN